MKRKTISKAVREQNKRTEGVWKSVMDSVSATYGCLLPQGEITCTVILPWAREEFLGVLKRNGKILSWKQDREFEEGNNRRYLVTLNTAKI